MPITDKKEIDRFYKALVEKDPAFVGSFVVGVKTTSICCISTCRARKPKKENVIFYKDLKEALASGFRPCKICDPTSNSYDTPVEVQKAIQLIKENPKEKYNDQKLRDLGISPSILRRWFKKQFGITFHAYQRMYRINQAVLELKEGKKTTEVALEQGYDSLSGFSYIFKKITGHSPKNMEDRSPILLDRFNTPLGPMYAAATAKGLCLVEFTDRRMLETEFKELQRRFQQPLILGSNTHTEETKKQLSEYFEGKRKEFDLEFDLFGTDFQKEVWRILQEIPYGQVVSYQDQANKIGNPKAVRAVARANGMNHIAIIIPCHRVIGKDGSLTGYAGGLERKRWLLDFESSQKQLDL